MKKLNNKSRIWLEERVDELNWIFETRKNISNKLILEADLITDILEGMDGE